MIRAKSLSLRYQPFQDKMESEFMSAPNIPSLTYYGADLQTYEYNFPTADNQSGGSSFASDPYLSWVNDVDQQIEELREENEEACTLDEEIESIPDSAYDDAYWLLEMLFDCNVPTPDIGWLVDGGIGFEWRSKNKKGIGTISVYGDNQVVYGASLGSTDRVKGTCALSDIVSLYHFFANLIILCS